MHSESIYIGRQIGNYRIIKKIGDGPFSTVYQGENYRLQKGIISAIKILHTTISPQQNRDVFLRETRLLRQLKHRHILPIFDIAIDLDVAYLVTEYAPLGSLKERLQLQESRPIPIKEAITIISQVGAALQFAYQNNILHKNLKPENILFNMNKSALLSDFDISSVLRRAGVRKTRSGTGSVDSISPNNDLYALGKLAYELCTGHTLSYQRIGTIPLAPRILNPLIPQAIELALLKSISVNPADRYENVGTFI